MATATNQEAPNTLLSESTLKILDMYGEGPILGFARKNPDLPMDPLMSVYFDDVPIRNVDGSYNFNVSGDGFGFDYMLGTATQSGISGFEKVETVIPLSSNTLISNPVQGQGPYKTVVTSFNTDTYPDADSIKVTVRIPALYMQDENANTNGYEIAYAVDIALNNGAYVAQNPVDGTEPDAEILIQGKCTVPYLKTLTYKLPKTTPPTSRMAWRVRVRRTSQDIQRMTVQNAAFVDSISVVSTNGYAYPNTAMGAIRIAAGQFSSIPSRSVELYGALVSVPNGYTPTQYQYGYDTYVITGGVTTADKNIGIIPQDPAVLDNIEYGMKISAIGLPAGSYITDVGRNPLSVTVSVSEDPTITTPSTPLTITSLALEPQITAATYPAIWTGDFVSNVWTDNPAWIFYDLITDPVHGLGDYIQSSSVDKWTLYQIAQYCDEMVDDGAGGLEPRFTCNVAIQQPEQAYSVLLNLASTFRGMMYYANGTIQLSQTTDDKVPVYEFTNANVVDGRFTYADTAKDTRSTVALVKWRDPNNGFRESVQYIEDVEGIQRYGYVQKEVSAFACASPGQAYRLGIWSLQTERLLTETITFQTSLEGLYLRPGDNFAVYDNFRNNRSQGGRIVGFSTGRSFVDLDRPVTLSPGITYTLTAITPKAVFDDPSSITGSDQIDLIRQSQIETYRVIDSAGTYTRLGMAGQFDSGIYPGSPWVLSASGYTGIFDSASFYTCLATSEIEPGKIEVLGLQANTGIQFLVSTGYTVVDDPPNAGDSSAISPPSNLQITFQTGALADNTFYSNLKLSWDDTPDRYRNFAQYEVSGKAYNEAAYEQYFTTAPGTTWNLYTGAQTGRYDFSVAAISVGGVRSPFITTNYTVPATNPFGHSPPLSGVFITEGFDDYLFAPDGAYTGFVGTTPTLGWNFQQNSQGYDLPQFDLIAGYQIRISGFDNTDYLSPSITIDGRDNSTYTFPEGFLYTGLGGFARRGFQFFVDTIDNYGSIATGGKLSLNNPPPKAPAASGFVGFNGGFQYSITPQATDVDVSGLYLWWDNNPSFTPQFGNQNRVTTNLTDILLNDIYQTTDYYAWFALTDTFGYTGCSIYGPVRVNPNGSVSGAYFNLNQRIDSVSSQTSGVSGYLNAQIANVYTALTSTGIAMAQYTSTVLASTTGANASVQILTRAMITGSVGGYGGFPVATWGVKLNANGSAASLVANITGQAEYGTLTLSGLQIQSAGYTPGVAGWKISPSGDAEFWNAVVRGAFTGGAGSSQTSINSVGITVGSAAADRIVIDSTLAGHQINSYNSSNYNTTVIGTASPGGYGFLTISDSVGSAKILMAGSDGSINCDILGVDGVATFNSVITNATAGGWTVPLRTSSTAHDLDFQWDGTYFRTRVDGATTLGPKFGTASIAGMGGTLSTVSSRFDIRGDSSNSIALSTNGTQRWIIGGSDGHIKTLGAYDIRKASSDGWSPILYDGTYSLEFQSDGTQIYGRINGGSAILLG